MSKSLFFGMRLVLALLLVPTLMAAQEVTEAVDSIEVDPYEGMIIESIITAVRSLRIQFIWMMKSVNGR